MLYHILGWLTLVWTLGTGAYTTHYLWNAGKETRSWLQRLPVPLYAEGELHLSSGSDYVGVI